MQNFSFSFFFCAFDKKKHRKDNLSQAISATHLAKNHRKKAPKKLFSLPL
jgi:hypothetical protein